MFWRAGFNRRHRVLVHAVIARGDRNWRRPARLVRFLPSGELAWVGPGGISWPEHVRICSYPGVRHAWVPSIGMPSEDLR